jgi:uroporphyrinogen decarboxylase
MPVITNDRFLRACRRQETDTTPIWLMRQAGRYMPEYRAVREKHGFLQMVKTPELAAEVTMQPVQAYAVDAAIIFADILPPLEGMGLTLTYEAGEGPVIHNPLRTPADVEALRVPDPRETVAYTLEAIRLTKRELAGRIPLIGFSGAPFTLASYAIEGGGSREYRRTKQLMYREPDVWHTLMSKLADLVGAYLVAQVEAGADALQLFDSWAGALSPGDYAEYVLPYVQRAIAFVKTDAVIPAVGAQHAAPLQPGLPPIIYFGTDTAGLLGLLRHTGADVVGADWRIALDNAWAALGPGVAIQGNLDPMTLFAPWPEIERRAKDILDRAAGRPGHVFNLGHGILTETPVENVRRLVDFVHEYSAAQ